MMTCKFSGPTPRVALLTLCNFVIEALRVEGNLYATERGLAELLEVPQKAVHQLNDAITIRTGSMLPKPVIFAGEEVAVIDARILHDVVSAFAYNGNSTARMIVDRLLAKSIMANII